MIRPIQLKDHEAVKEMLEAEGAIEDFPHLLESEGYVEEEEGDIIGFFGYIIWNRIPVLRHFCVKKGYRGIKSTNKLINGYVDIVRKNKFKLMMFMTNETFKKLYEWKFRVKPFKQTNGIYYFLKEV